MSLVEEVLRVLVQRKRATLDAVVPLEHVGRDTATVGHLPGSFVLGRVVDAMLHHPTALEHEGAQTGLAEFLHRPATGHAGADDDGVELDLGAGLPTQAHERPIASSGTSAS